MLTSVGWRNCVDMKDRNPLPITAMSLKIAQFYQSIPLPADLLILLKITQFSWTIHQLPIILLNRETAQTCPTWLLPSSASFGQQALTACSHPPLKICTVFTVSVLCCPHFLPKKNFAVLPPSWARSRRISLLLQTTHPILLVTYAKFFLIVPRSLASRPNMCSALFHSFVLSPSHLHLEMKDNASW